MARVTTDKAIDDPEKQNDELKSSLDFTKTRTDHIAVWIIEVLGSMKFLVFYILIFTVWIA